MTLQDDDIVLLGGKRSAIGGFGGTLAALSPIDLGTAIARAAIEDAGIAPEKIGQVVMGHVINTEPADMYLSRRVAIGAGISETTPAMNVNRLCGSGLQAIVSAYQFLAMGDADFALAGGAESMSRAPHILPAARWGQKMGDVGAVDMMLGALTCPFGTGHMGVTAENLAQDQAISRADQDAFALESQTRAQKAQAAGYFDNQIAPISIKTRKGVVEFVQDEHPKATTLDALAALKPVFQKDGSVTAGNASGINDGAAAVILGRAGAARALGLRPRARILGYAIAGVAPRIMGYGPVPAVRNLLEKCALSVDDFDVIESNEAFAAQALAVNRGLSLDPARVNIDGGAIALGHPVGATGAIITIKALSILDRIGGRRALVTMCIGGGQGIALALERV